MDKNKKKAGWGAERAHRLDNEERRAALPPEETLLKLGLGSGMDFADIGCGVGYFSLPAAWIVGTGAKVFAADVSADMLAILSEKAAGVQLSNIAVVLADEYDMKIEDGSADFALCSIVLHEIENKIKFARELARVLAPGGTLAVIEWKMIEGGKGPGLADRISYAALQDILRECGFDDFDKKDLGTDLYAVTAKRI